MSQDIKIIDMPFLYPDRLAELALKLDQPMPTDDFNLSDFKPKKKSVQRSRMDLSSKIADNQPDNKPDDVIEKHKTMLLDYLIERSGYPGQNSKDFSDYRLQFESIIMKNGGIFEELFLQIQRNIKEIAKQRNKSENDVLIIKDAREKALSDLADKYFNRLGSYHKNSSKYYFDENEIATSLSKYFLTELYKNTDFAKKMLEAQKDKTLGQHAGMRAEFTKLRPTAYNHNINDLKNIENNFDLFLASPSIINIPNERRESHADLLKKLHEQILEQPDGARNDNDIQEYIDENFSKFKSKLGSDNYLGEFSKEFNPVEQVFVIHGIMLDICSKNKEKLIEAQGKFKKDKNEKMRQLKDVADRVTEEYLLEKYQVKSLKSFNKREASGIFNEIKKTYPTNEAYQKLKQEIDELNENSRKLDDDFNQEIKEIKDFKEGFIQKYYPQVIPAANGLAKSYKMLLEKKNQNADFLKNGGTHSCLSFLPIKIKEKDGYRLECLVAMSGAEFDDEHSINPHAILEQFVETLGTVPNISGEDTFEFRYVGPSSHSLDLLLKQVGKGLSGSNEPLSPLKLSPTESTVLPVFEKACAEKRLINELINLYARYGEDVDILGCDNIALPRYIDLEQKAAKNSSKKSTFTLDTNLRNSEDEPISLKAGHILCCASCQAQKPAVMTVLFDAATKKGAENKKDEQEKLVVPEAVNEEIKSIYSPR